MLAPPHARHMFLSRPARVRRPIPVSAHTMCLGPNTRVPGASNHVHRACAHLSLIHISEPTRPRLI
eukprot:474780-Rhodomonas_salina.1